MPLTFTFSIFHLVFYQPSRTSKVWIKTKWILSFMCCSLHNHTVQTRSPHTVTSTTIRFQAFCSKNKKHNTTIVLSLVFSSCPYCSQYVICTSHELHVQSRTKHTITLLSHGDYLNDFQSFLNYTIQLILHGTRFLSSTLNTNLHGHWYLMLLHWVHSNPSAAKVSTQSSPCNKILFQAFMQDIPGAVELKTDIYAHARYSQLGHMWMTPA